MTEAELNEQTREDWRELGFFYDFDKNNCCWRLIGSQQGLLKFSDILNEYANDARKAALSEHEHYGPYWYLKLTTWEKPAITANAIYGRLEDFQSLSKLVKQKLLKTVVGDRITIDKEYSLENEARIVFEVKSDDFDASEADSLLKPL